MNEQRKEEEKNIKQKPRSYRNGLVIADGPEDEIFISECCTVRTFVWQSVLLATPRLLRSIIQMTIF